MPTYVADFLSLLLSVSIKAALLASIAGVTLLAFRVRDANLRHRVWTSVLVSMLALPLLVHLRAGSASSHRDILTVRRFISSRKTARCGC